ncbi:macrophage-expressed gene 1 protein-like [Tubulanus polymorphus]|uniref:macrophage-expressed gene 1 protein-like n=1 Tax=Tubulanus polymorphus TaxID=672921 RepID=UPI003DA2BC17
MESVLLICLLFCCGGMWVAAGASDAAVAEANGFKYRKDDPQHCPQLQKDIMDVLPGAGFDNLRNVEMGMVLKHRYDDCRITLDRRYIIPDDVTVTPEKRSSVDITSQIYDHWTNFTSTDSRTINADAHASFGWFGSVSGSYSSEKESIRKSQVNDDTVTSRVQVRHTLYKIRAEPGTPLAPGFDSQSRDIVSFLQAGDKRGARYLAQLLVRDFGTHYVTGKDAGGAIVQTDSINASYVNRYSMDKSKVTAAASGSFLGMFGGGGSYSHSTSKELIDQYIKNRKHSQIFTYGGPAFRANFTLNQWEDGLHDNLVAVDRFGDPLHYAITPETFRDLPLHDVKQLAETVREAVESYYKHNAYKGCTNSNSKNFDIDANIDDGTCKGSSNNFTFGGVYQTCQSPLGDCGKYAQVNPKTGTYSCPDDYESVLIHNGPGFVCKEKCHGWWIFKRCHTECYVTGANTGTPLYRTYWCAATHTVQPNSGYLFGGTYTTSQSNPLTKQQNCPTHFYPLKMTESAFVCVSDDYEFGFRYSVPFAGFFSCESGNPLTILEHTGILQSSKQNTNQLHSLLGYLQKNADPKSWPKRCPIGFSQHLALISDGCEINFCAKANSIPMGIGLPLIRRPPYNPKPLTIINGSMFLMTADRRIKYKSMETGTWKEVDLPTAKAIYQGEWKSIQPADKPASDQTGPAARTGVVDGLSTSSVAGIVIGTLCVAVMVVLVVALSIRRHRRLKAPLLRRTAAADANNRYSTFESEQASETGSVNTESV